MRAVCVTRIFMLRKNVRIWKINCIYSHSYTKKFPLAMVLSEHDSIDVVLLGDYY